MKMKKPLKKIVKKGAESHPLYRGLVCIRSSFAAIVYCSEQKKNIRFGPYTDATTAARVYDRERVKRGRSRVNFPLEDNSNFVPPKAHIKESKGGSGHKFVYACNGRFQVVIRVDKEQRYLGSTKVLKEAVELRDKELKKLKIKL